MKDYNNEGQRSKIVKDTINQSPSFLENWGLLIFLILISATLFTASKIKYPVIISGKAILYCKTKQIPIKANHAGKLRISNGIKRRIKKGDQIAQIEGIPSSKNLVKTNHKILRINKLHDLQIYNSMLNTTNKLIFLNYFYILKKSISNWLPHFIVISPTDGILRFNKQLGPFQTIKKNQTIAYLTPFDPEIYIKLDFPPNTAISTNTELEVRINITSNINSGFIKGKLINIHSLGQMGKYTAKIKIPNETKSKLNDFFKNKNELIAQAIVITKYRNLFQSLYLSIFKNSTIRAK